MRDVLMKVPDALRTVLRATARVVAQGRGTDGWVAGKEVSAEIGEECTVELESLVSLGILDSEPVFLSARHAFTTTFYRITPLGVSVDSVPHSMTPVVRVTINEDADR